MGQGAWEAPGVGEEEGDACRPQEEQGEEEGSVNLVSGCGKLSKKIIIMEKCWFLCD